MHREEYYWTSNFTCEQYAGFSKAIDITPAMGYCNLQSSTGVYRLTTA